ncbi:hypothetical protein [Sphingomonas endolithica]|uniref:hypothetical protein n=1 Tax=Sphingomonas endolithica TaxID=2972485 RepID=UPI0021AF807C|nr:hypothetical protein [Sphingomonas sp. ZFBP2030]
MFEQRCLPLAAVQARHSRLMSVHRCGETSSSAKVASIISFSDRGGSDGCAVLTSSSGARLQFLGAAGVQ